MGAGEAFEQGGPYPKLGEVAAVKEVFLLGFSRFETHSCEFLLCSTATSPG